MRTIPYALVPGVAALLAVGGCDRAAPTAPQTFASAAVRTSPLVPLGGTRALGGTTGSLVQLVDIKRARGGPSTIDPCWLVNRGLYEADAHNGRFSVELTFTYSSRGTLVTRTFDVPLHDARPEDDADARASFVELTIPLDVGDAVPDAGAAIDGEIVLVRTSGDGRVVVDVSRLTAGG